MLVDQLQIAVTLCRRTASGREMEILSEPNDGLALGSLACGRPLSTIYERTQLLRDPPQ